MPKLDFSDFYKFLVSLGVVLTIGSFLLPELLRGWLVARAADLKRAQDGDLVEVSQNTLREALRGAHSVYELAPLITGLGLVAGLVLTVVGMLKWAERQTLLEEKDALEREKLRGEIRAMTPEEKITRAVNDSNLVGLDVSEVERARTEVLDRLVSIFGDVTGDYEVRGDRYFGIPGTTDGVYVDVFAWNRAGGLSLVFEVRLVTQATVSAQITHAAEALRRAIDFHALADLPGPIAGVVLLVVASNESLEPIEASARHAPIPFKTVVQRLDEVSTIDAAQVGLSVE